MQVSTINQPAFKKAFEEYQYCNMEFLKLGRHPILECPACFGSQHSIHVDGNRISKKCPGKHFPVHLNHNYLLLCRGIRNSCYEGMFIARNGKVDDHLEIVGYRDDRVCNICDCIYTFMHISR